VDVRLHKGWPTLFVTEQEWVALQARKGRPNAARPTGPVRLSGLAPEVAEVRGAFPGARPQAVTALLEALNGSGKVPVIVED
jgi:hypothetical protein